MAKKNYADYTRDELIRLLQARDQRDATRFGLVWESNEIERDKALNTDFVALDLVPELSCMSPASAPAGWASAHHSPAEAKDGGLKPTLQDAPPAYRNLIIEGDNFDALRYLKMCFAGRVKCIYIDPPYNTGNKDFVYNDHYVDKDDLWRHSTWCEFMFQRLTLAKDLLAQDGAIFVSIDDNEIASLRLIMERVFGASNFATTLVWEKGKKGGSKLFSITHEYIVVFVANAPTLEARKTIWRKRKAGVDEVLAKYQSIRQDVGSDHDLIRKKMQAWFKSLKPSDPAKANKHYNWSDERGLYFPDNFHGPDDGRDSRPRYEIYHPTTGEPCKKPSTGWRWEEPTTQVALAEKPPRIHFGKDHTTIPCRKSYLFEVDSELMQSVFYKDGRSATLEVERILNANAFSFPKDKEVIGDLIRLCLNGDKDALILDFFAGSGTTAHAVHKLNKEDGGNRRVILVSSTEATADEPEKNLCRDVCATRVRRVIEGYGDTPGLGGDFAYLRTRRIAPGRLTDIDHAQVWTALQLTHLPTLNVFDDRQRIAVADHEEQRVIYVPHFLSKDTRPLIKLVKDRPSVIVYTWQMDYVRTKLRDCNNVQVEAIPDALARRFGLRI